MKVIATAKGFYGGQIRDEGDEFSVPEGFKLGSWMQPVEGGKPAETVKPKGKVAPATKPVAEADAEVM